MTEVDRSITWFSEEAARATGGRVTQAWSGKGFSIDTRTLKDGDVFVALFGNRNGHEFVSDAFERGASAAIVSQELESSLTNKPLLIVEDTMIALNHLAREARRRSKAKVIGVTGSVGKTTTKNMLGVALSVFGKVHLAEKSFNNHIGVPLTLASMPRDCDFSVIEIGMSSKNEILPLAQLATPDVAIITNIAEAHLQQFNSLEEIMLEKADIAKPLKKGSPCVINKDSELYDSLLGVIERHGAKPVTYGIKENSDFQLLNSVTLNNMTCSELNLPDGNKLFIKLSSIGYHNTVNAVGALAAVGSLGLDIPLAAIALSTWKATKGRGSFINVKSETSLLSGNFLIIDESYNANPKSLIAALEVLSQVQPTHFLDSDLKRLKRIAVLGDMLELGTAEYEIHRSLARAENFKHVDMVHCVGKRMKHLYDALPKKKRGKWVSKVEEAVPFLKKTVTAGNIIMLKASNGLMFSKLVKELSKLGDCTDAHI